MSALTVGLRAGDAARSMAQTALQRCGDNRPIRRSARTAIRSRSGDSSPFTTARGPAIPGDRAAVRARLSPTSYRGIGTVRSVPPSYKRR